MRNHWRAASALLGRPGVFLCRNHSAKRWQPAPVCQQFDAKQTLYYKQSAAGTSGTRIRHIRLHVAEWIAYVMVPYACLMTARRCT